MNTPLHTLAVSLSSLRLLARSLLAGLPLFAAACDPFRVSECRFENLPGCGSESRAPLDGSVKPPDPDSGPALGPLRRFELRASVSLGTMRRFVGLQGSPRQAVFLVTNGATKWWELVKLDLNNSQVTDRVISSASCPEPTCPAIPATMNFAIDRIYRTADSFYYFDYKSTKTIMSLPTMTIQGDCMLGTSMLRPFLSVQGNSFMVSHRDYERFCVRFSDNVLTVLATDGTHDARAFVIGNLDVNDEPVYDLEAISFDNDAYFLRRSSAHNGSAIQMALSKSINDDSAVVGGAIQAAYIGDINGDKFPDLVFVRGGRVRAMSYRGMDREVFLYKLTRWDQDVALAIEGEAVQYIALDELTQDSYQDLIVETDKQVHFYRNVAM